MRWGKVWEARRPAFLSSTRIRFCAETVIFEAAFTLEKFYKVPRGQIRGTLLDLLQLPGIVLPGKRAYRRVFDLWVERAGLSFADCYHAVLVERLGLPALITFDHKFDRVAGVTRREP